MRFQLLGPLTLAEGRETVVLKPSKPTSLLAALLLHPGTVVPTGHLLRVLWDESPPTTARAALQSCVLRLRRLFGTYGAGGDLIEAVPGGYRMNADADTLDLVRFRALVRGADGTGDVEGELYRLKEALTLWQGPLLANVPSALLHRDEVPGLTEERLRALERACDIELALGLCRQVLVDLWETARRHPGRERFSEQLIEALYRTGRQSEALAEYRSVKERLKEELGIDPGPGLQRLELAILRGDGLGPPAVDRATPLPGATTTRLAPPGTRELGSGAAPHSVPKALTAGPPAPARRTDRAGADGLAPARTSPGTVSPTSPGPADEITAFAPRTPADGPAEPPAPAVPGRTRLRLPGADGAPGGAPTSAVRPVAPAPPALLSADRPPAPAVPCFAGRSRERAALGDRLASGAQGVLVIVSGAPGIGKTALALQTAHDAQGAFPGGVFTPAMTRPDGSAREPAEIRTELPPPGTGGGRSLIVLDDVTGADQVRPLLPATADSAVVITSRRGLAGLVATHGGSVHRLDVLAPEESQAVLAAALGPERVAAEPAAARELAEVCGHFPLGLRIAAARLLIRPGLRIGDCAAWLAEDPTARLSLADDPRLSVPHVFGDALRRLEPHRQDVFRQLGELEGLLVTPRALGDPARAEEALERLADAGLLEEGPPGPYRIHALLKIYARRQARDAPEAHRRTARARH